MTAMRFFYRPKFKILNSVWEEASLSMANSFGMGLFSLAVFIQNICGSAAEYSNTSS